jgi:hypothetical protein
MEEEGGGEEENQDHMQEDNTHNSSMGGANRNQMGSKEGKSIMHYIPAQTRLKEADMPQGEPIEDVKDVVDIDVQGLDELHTGHNSPQPADHGSEIATPRAVAECRELAAIPEADTPMRRSKRRANSADQTSLENVEQIKVARNVDYTSKKGGYVLVLLLVSAEKE